MRSPPEGVFARTGIKPSWAVATCETPFDRCARTSSNSRVTWRIARDKGRCSAARTRAADPLRLFAPSGYVTALLVSRRARAAETVFSIAHGFRIVVDSVTVASSAGVSLQSANRRFIVGSALAHCRDETMLPAPFYDEVPSDLGDDETWARQAARGHCEAKPSHAACRCLHAALSDIIVSVATALVGRIRRMFAAET